MGDEQTDKRTCVCVCVYLSALWQGPGRMSPGPWADHSAAVRDEASTRTAFLASRAVVIGLSRSGIRHCNCGAGLSVGDLRNPNLFQLRLLGLGSGLSGASQAFQGCRSRPRQRRCRSQQGRVDLGGAGRSTALGCPDLRPGERGGDRKWPQGTRECLQGGEVPGKENGGLRECPEWKGRSQGSLVSRGGSQVGPRGRARQRSFWG